MMDDSIEYNSSDLAYIVEQLGMRPLDPDIVGTELDGGGLAEASEEELQEYYFGRIDFDTHDHVFVERACADYRAACRSGKHGDMDADWHPTIEEEHSQDYDLPEYDTVEDGGTAGGGDGECDVDGCAPLP
mmetsp:Transcript_84452/g.253277  ORF Transcript_84452/g.253277 Transcript_84452/m.253277 type:complete len:131 (-) Transcript_84452:107-499(-)